MGLFSKIFNNEIKDNNTTSIPKNINGKFHMIIDDVFTINGRGTVVTGKIDSGEIHIGDIIYINQQRTAEVLGIEMFRKNLDYAKAGENCGILLKNISKEEIHQGDYLSK